MSLTKKMNLTKLLARNAPGARTVIHKKKLSRKRFNRNGREPLVKPVRGAFVDEVKGGIESLYDKSYHPRMVYRAAMLGLTEKEMCVFMDVPIQTFGIWKTKHPELVEGLKKGREHADSKVVMALYRAAVGWGHLEEEIVTRKVKTTDENGVVTEDLKIIRIPVRKKFPPNIKAAEYWLSHRQKEKWGSVENPRDSVLPVNFTLNLNQLTTEELRLAQKLGQMKQVKQLEPDIIIDADAEEVSDEA